MNLYCIRTYPGTFLEITYLYIYIMLLVPVLKHMHTAIILLGWDHALKLKKLEAVNVWSIWITVINIYIQ